MSRLHWIKRKGKPEFAVLLSIQRKVEIFYKMYIHECTNILFLSETPEYRMPHLRLVFNDDGFPWGLR